MLRPLTYLAGPYTYKHGEAVFKQAIERVRFEALTKAAAWLMVNYGWNVFSPITHSHPMHLFGKVPGDWAFWKQVDTEYLACSARIVVLTIPGWRNSVGVTAELEIAKSMEIPVQYLAPDGPDNFILSDEPADEPETNFSDDY